MTRRPYSPRLTEQRVTYLLLCAADETPRTAAELVTEAARLGASIPVNNRIIPLHRLVAHGSLTRDSHRPAYTLTPRGERHRRVLEAALPAQLARVLLRATSEPQSTRALCIALAVEFGVTTEAIWDALKRLEALDLVTLSGKKGAYQIALTELGAATLPDAREVVAFVDGAA